MEKSERRGDYSQNSSIFRTPTHLPLYKQVTTSLISPLSVAGLELVSIETLYNDSTLKAEFIWWKIFKRPHQLQLWKTEELYRANKICILSKIYAMDSIGFIQIVFWVKNDPLWNSRAETFLRKVKKLHLEKVSCLLVGSRGLPLTSAMYYISYPMPKIVVYIMFIRYLCHCNYKLVSEMWQRVLLQKFTKIW